MSEMIKTNVGYYNSPLPLPETQLLFIEHFNTPGWSKDILSIYFPMRDFMC